MKVLFDGTIPVSYGFVHLDSGVGGWDQEIDTRGGQRNGLAGAIQAGFVDLVVGTHTGSVPIRIELHRKAPGLDGRWDEIVEVSCDLRSRRLEVTAFQDSVKVRRVRQNGPHRVRYSALRFDDDRERDDDQVALDRYLVQLWPAAMAADVVVKQTSEGAAYWHDEARRSAKSNPTPLDQALAERGAEAEREAADRRFAREEELRSWGGREPSPALRRVAPARRLLAHHRGLLDAVEALPPEQQRHLAIDVARQACAADHQSPVDWAPALEALEDGQPLPAPFDDEDAVMDLMFGPHAAMSATVSKAVPDAPPPRIYTGVSASAAVRAAADPDPFAAALRAIEAGSWSAPDEAQFFADLEARVR